MKAQMMNRMQSFARALVVPILFLPIFGILLAIMSIISSPTIVGQGNILINVGKFVSSGLGPLFGNLSLIFCVGISMGLAKEKKAEAALIAVFSYLFFLGANNGWLSLTGRLIPYTAASELQGTGQTLSLGFQIVDMGVFLGIILGIMVSLVHNKFCNKQFPEAVAIYGNTKLVFMVLIPVLLGLAIVFSYVWPVVASGINALTHFINGSGAFGVFLYGFLNRFLIPTGLHHLINIPFVYTDMGGKLVIDGHAYTGAMNIFLAQLADPATSVFDTSTKYMQYGMVKMFGALGVALAFYRTAKPENKTKLKAILIPAAATAFLAGITEPLEFTFLFVAPFLWLVYSVMDGLFQMVAVLFGSRVNSMSGIFDLIVYNIVPGAAKTRWPIYVGVGVVQLGVFYAVFKTLIQKFKLKTPGREDSSEDIRLISKKEYREKMAVGAKEAAAGLDKDDILASAIIQGLGGRTNIQGVDNCFTRLRIDVADPGLVNEIELKGTGAAGVILNGNNIQIVYGPKVNSVRNSVDKYLAG